MTENCVIWVNGLLIEYMTVTAKDEAHIVPLSFSVQNFKAIGCVNTQASNRCYVLARPYDKSRVYIRCNTYGSDSFTVYATVDLILIGT